MKIENIKFKAKRLDGKGWVCGYFYEENGNTYIIENRQKESKLNRNLTYQVDPSTVCQFTGMADCKGNEIWEGDIVDVRGVKAEVIWNQDALAFMVLYEYETEPITYLAFINRHSNVLVLHSKFDKEK
nr:MAG TPA: YopX protein [Caudoviricetes sp.]